MVKNSPAPLLRRLQKHSRTVALGALVAFAPVAVAGCYGNFSLTKAVYKFNGEVSENDNGVVQSIVFWVFVILPVYGLAMLGDAVIFNLIEFWTDKPLDLGSTTTTPDGYTVTLLPGAVYGEAIMTLSKDGKVLSEQRMVKVSDTEFAIYDGDKVAGKVYKESTGDLRLTDSKGKTVRTVNPQQV